MKVFNFLFVALAVPLLFLQPVSAKKKSEKDTWNYRYEIECASVGQDGSYVVNVWSYSKSKKFDPVRAGANAVHGVIFKGVSGRQGCPSQPALVRDPSVRESKKDYWNKFFDENGDSGKYVLSVSPTVERVKIKGGWKFRSTVQVAKDQLRRDLEAAGVLRGLSSGF